MNTTTSTFTSTYTSTLGAQTAENVQREKFRSQDPNVDYVMLFMTSIFMISSFFGNVFLIFCFFKYLQNKLKKCFIVYISIMAADLIQGLFAMPFTAYILSQVHEIDKEVAQKGIFQYACNISGFVYNVVSRVAIHLIFILTLDRFLAIYQPQFHRTRCSRLGYTIAVVLVWVMDILISCSPYMKGLTYKYALKMKSDSMCTFYITDFIRDDSNNFNWNKGFALYLGLIFIPISMIIILNVVLSIMLLYRLKLQMSNSQRSSKKVYVYASQTILLMSLVYFLCYLDWNAIQVVSTIQALYGVIFGTKKVTEMSKFILNNGFANFASVYCCVFAFANSAISPIVLYWRIVRVEMLSQRSSTKQTSTSKPSLKSILRSSLVKQASSFFAKKKLSSAKDHVMYSKMEESNKKKDQIIIP